MEFVLRRLAPNLFSLPVGLCNKPPKTFRKPVAAAATCPKLGIRTAEATGRLILIGYLSPPPSTLLEVGPRSAALGRFPTRLGTVADDEQSIKARAEAQHHRADLTGRLTDATKLLAAQFLRNEARCAAYFRVGLLQAPVADPLAKEQY